MESPRFLLAVTLMIAVIVAVNLIFPPVRTPRSTAPDSAASTSAPIPPAAASSSASGQPTATPAPAPTTVAPAVPAPATGTPGTVDTVVVQSPLYRYGFSTQGAAMVSAELLLYESFTRP